ncbi:MAG: YfiR family protein [Porticoccaceae bacterium]|nr:YfiR family protein [Porticoccaceae bacterium]
MIRVGINFAIPWLLLLGILFSPMSRSQPQDKVEEYNLKAALVYNFARFSQWPENSFSSADTPVALCVQGDQSLIKSFGLLAKKTLFGRPVSIVVAETLVNPESCNVIFVTGVQRQGLPRLFAAVADQPILTIGEMNGFTDIGGMILFTTVHERLKFSVNLENTEAGGISLSSRLLKLAHVIEGQETQR